MFRKFCSGFVPVIPFSDVLLCFFLQINLSKAIDIVFCDVINGGGILLKDAYKAEVQTLGFEPGTFQLGVKHPKPVFRYAVLLF